MIRRGLPRVAGGEPWPPAREVPASRVVTPPVSDAADAAAVEVALAETGAPTPSEAIDEAVALSDVPLRRGLPRVAGGPPWPPEGRAPARAVRTVVAAETVEAPAAHAPAAAASAGASAEDATPSPATPAVPAASEERAARTRTRTALVWAAIALGALAVLVVIARLLVSLDGVAAFIDDHPGTYALPEGAPVGIPAWLSWTHFFNAFLLVLIVRTGLEVRRQTRPAAYWSRTGHPQERIGLPSWTHQALDVLWVVNGAVYIVLLFVTGQWMRIVPTSWEVIPGTLSTTLQYLSLDWPVEDGWTYYNSLQQLTYFVTVFVAAPLAIATGVRMSIYWRGGKRWDRLYPKSVARSVHFPVMIYFVAFVVGHVALVLATGARENLNHMYAGRDDASWLGLGIFALSLVVIIGAAVALRPVLVAPIASRWGTVSSR